MVGLLLIMTSCKVQDKNSNLEFYLTEEVTDYDFSNYIPKYGIIQEKQKIIYKGEFVVILDTLEKIKNQISKDIEQYKNLNINDITVFIDNDNICFKVDNYIHTETEKEFLTAYVGDVKVDIESAIALNTATMLYQMDDIKKELSGKF